MAHSSLAMITWSWVSAWGSKVKGERMMDVPRPDLDLSPGWQYSLGQLGHLVALQQGVGQEPDEAGLLEQREVEARQLTQRFSTARPWTWSCCRGPPSVRWPPEI